MTKRKEFGRLRVYNAVRRVGREYGFTGISDWAADYILWEYTGFPGFWPSGNLAKDLEVQLREFFEQTKVHPNTLPTPPVDQQSQLKEVT